MGLIYSSIYVCSVPSLFYYADAISAFMNPNVPCYYCRRFTVHCCGSTISQNKMLNVASIGFCESIHVVYFKVMSVLSDIKFTYRIILSIIQWFICFLCILFERKIILWVCYIKVCLTVHKIKLEKIVSSYIILLVFHWIFFICSNREN